MISFKEKLVEKGMDLNAFAMRMNMTTIDAERLVNGQKEVTPDIAEKLKMVLRVDVTEKPEEPEEILEEEEEEEEEENEE